MRSIPSALVLLVAPFLALAARSISTATRPGFETAEANLQSEALRIASHLEAVESRLRAADVSHLGDAERAARAQHLDVLREYRLAGRFPHNHGVSEGLIPIFVDPHGTHCAVAYLLARSGESDLVARVASTRNTATVAELADEPGLLDWLAANGLTAEEAGQIQPAYRPPPTIVRERDGSYLATTAALTAVGAGTSTWNALADRSGSAWYLPGVASLASGVASVFWGWEGIGREESEFVRERDTYYIRKPSEANVVINFLAGAVSLGLGIRTFVLGQDDRPATASREQDDSGALRLELVPAHNGLGAKIRF
jgi:hypothetical protein